MRGRGSDERRVDATINERGRLEYEGMRDEGTRGRGSNERRVDAASNGTSRPKISAAVGEGAAAVENEGGLRAVVANHSDGGRRS